jgi:aspartyl-tRNA(Asn)/glutamyl-tRNA(Gln) amidotransferase subunit C
MPAANRNRLALARFHEDRTGGDSGMKITREDVTRVADLAHLELSEAEIETLSRQLDSILTYVEKLNELNTEGVEPMAQVVPPGAAGQGQSASTPLREDIVEPCAVIGEVLANAPDPEGPYFGVPKVIER